MTPKQCRAARHSLGWSTRELAALVGVSETAIGTFERGARGLRYGTAEKIRQAFRAEGIDVDAL